MKGYISEEIDDLLLQIERNKEHIEELENDIRNLSLDNDELEREIQTLINQQ